MGISVCICPSARVQEKGIALPGAGVTGSSKLPGVGAGNELSPYGRASGLLTL